MIPYCILAIENESDREFMTALYFQYQKLIYRTIQKSITDPWLVDDVAQTVLERLIDKISLLRSIDHNRLANYIISTCKNTAYNVLRYDARHKAFSFDELTDSAEAFSKKTSLDDQLLQHENISYISAAWTKLDQHTQYLLEARYILEKSPAEIASDLKIKPESVRMALTRARKKAYYVFIQELEQK